MTVCRWGLALLLFVAAAVAAERTQAQSPAELKVMTFNIRYGTAKDGENHWDKRREWLVETIKEFGPDLLGTQETEGFQRDYLAEKLEGYGVLGVGRDDGKEQGEMMAVFWRSARFSKTAGGHFWYSPTPDTPGSKGWDAALPRLATWVRLTDKAGGKPVLFVNTHFDHMGKAARAESARLLRRRLTELAAGSSVVLTGDFNSAEGSEPYTTVFGPLGADPSPVVDSYRIAHPTRAADEGTTTPFKTAASKGNRIDWIGVSRDWAVMAAGIDRSGKDGRAASDHFPVTTVLTR